MHCQNIAHFIKRGVKHRVHQVQRKQINSYKVCSKCPSSALTQARKRVGIGQLCHQSATAPSLATHAADAVAARQCHENDCDVMFTSEV